ncbi:MAG: TonB-dependent receptor, partial [Xanthomonadales bacterium]|nr:TonB-dependent receptor [Xanthomonadales bacterium]
SCSDFLDGTPNSFTSLGLCSDPNANDDSLSINRLGGTTYNDLQLSWRLPEDFLAATLTAGVNNVFDKDAPTCLTCSLNGYDASNYDLPGRFWYAKAAVKF